MIIVIEYHHNELQRDLLLNNRLSMLSNGGEEIVNWEEYIQMWDNASIQLVDIRQLVISSRGKQQYLLPANVFIYVVQGQGTIWLDGDIHIFERFYLLHAGKGSSISIEVGQGDVTYYYILYRGSMSAKPGHH